MRYAWIESGANIAAQRQPATTAANELLMTYLELVNTRQVIQEISRLTCHADLYPFSSWPSSNFPFNCFPTLVTLDPVK